VNFALFCPRANHLKILGPIMAEARYRGHTVSFMVAPADPKGAGALAHIEREVGGPIVSQMAFQTQIFDWAVAVGLRTAPELRARTRPAVKWAALDHAGDNLMFCLEGDTLDGWDVATTLSEEARDFTASLRAKTAAGLLPIGYPELDQLQTVVGDRAACRAKWNLPQGRFIRLFGPAARPAALGRWRRQWFEHFRYRTLLRNVRGWSPDNLLVAKTRAKHRDPSWLAQYCDRIIGDESFYPFTTLELLMAADHYVGFASALSIEAAAVGIPQTTLHGWPPEKGEWPSYWPLKREFFVKGDFSTNGLWRDDLSRAERRIACERWAGPLDGKASARFLDLLEA